MTDAPAPAASPAPAPTGAPPAAPAVAPPAATRPEWLPEAHWDDKSCAIKTEDFGKHYQEISTFYRTETEKRAALAARKADDIKIEVKLPETVKVPEGFNVGVDEKDPRIPLIRDLAQKRGLDQDTIGDLVALDAQMKIHAHAEESARIAAEDKKLGEKATDRKAAVASFFKGLKDRGDLSADEFEAVRVYATDAAAVTALEKIMGMVQRAVPGAGGDLPTPPKQELPIEKRWYGQKG